MKPSGTPGGNRLKALREYAGKTQLEVELEASLGMGYLQRVESGKVRHPERDTLERILSALAARYTERRDILELFGYLVDAPLPSADEIQWAVDACQTELDSAVFPVYLLDCTHRLLSWNRLVAKVFKVDDWERISMLRLIFDPAYGFAPRIANPAVFFPAQIRALRYEMSAFQNEPWYSALIADMLHNPIFAAHWTAAETLPTPQPTAARPLTLLQLNTPDAGLLQFRLTSEPFAQDRRFRVIYYLPADPQTMQQCAGWFQAP